ncbi:MAG: hypothetical protein RI899_44 [Actinomycetota bacterium]
MAVKKTAKKSAAKKSAKKVAKKSVARKSTTKKVAKKSTARKSAVKKSAKKSAARKTTKKSSRRATSVDRLVVPAVPVGGARGRVDVSTAPAPRAGAKSVSFDNTPKQGASNRVVAMVVVGIVLLAILVWAQSGKDGDDTAAPTTPSATATMTEEPTTPSETTTPSEPVGTVEAPSAFVAIRSADGMNLRWKAPMATEGLTGFNVELKSAGGDWAVVATTGPTELTHSVTLTSSDSWTQFRVSSVYSDGQTASAKIFGLAGQYK